MKHKTLITVLLAMALGALCGWMTGRDVGFAGVSFYQLYSLLAKLFLNGLSLVVVPLVVSSIITGTYRMASDGGFGKLGIRSLSCFLTTNFMAALTGILFALWLAPGAGQTLVSTVPQVQTGSTFDTLAGLLLRMVPDNITAAAAHGQILGLIVFSMIFGVCLSQIDARPREVIHDFLQGILQVMMRITKLVIRALPLGVFALVAKVIAETGADVFGKVGTYLFVVTGALFVYGFIFLPLFLVLVGRTDPRTHLKAMLPAMITAFTTASSAASIPVTLECAEKSGIRNRICRFIVPLGTSLNLSGSAVFVGVAAVTIAQAYGIALPLSSIMTILLMTVVSATGMAGIPSASIISVLMIMQALGLPAEGIGMILAVDRIVDMCRTSITVWGNSCCAAVIDRYEPQESVEVAA